MNWLTRIRQRFGRQDPGESLDVVSVLSAGLRDPVSAHRAIDLLKDERQRLVRRRKVVEKQFHRPTPRGMRQAGRLGPQLGSYQMSQDIRNANLAGQDSSRAGHVAAVEQQIQEVDTAVSQLRDRISQH